MPTRKQDKPLSVHLRPHPGTDGMAAAYLAWRLSEKITSSPSGCWEWQGAVNVKGYGVLYMKNYDWSERVVSVHRLVYRLCVAVLPEGVCVCHSCDNPKCVRPDHLFLGTLEDNVADKVSKNRQARGSSVRTNHSHLKGTAVVTAKLNDKSVMDIRRRAAEGESGRSIAKRFNVSPVTVSSIVLGRSWKHLPILTHPDRRLA